MKHAKGTHWAWWFIGSLIPVISIYVTYRLCKLLANHTQDPSEDYKGN